MLSLFNTKTKAKEKFKSLEEGVVKLYTCGPTVYNYAHLGNLRSYVFADVLKRTLTYTGYDVQHVTNVTDVGHLVSDGDEGEDKIEKAVGREGKSASEIANFYTKSFLQDLELLNIEKKSTTFPKATDYIPEQIQLIEKLEKKGHTYITSDGVYFDTSTFPTYGALGGIDLEGLKEGARVATNTEKKNPTDFALWKLSSKDSQRAQEWESPWGVGFPGWHIECSAMAMKILGEQIDIHTGGIDHIPVHHNNEIAQSKSATGKEFARFWLHNQFVNVSGGDKMAKSADNFLRLQTIIDRGIHPLAYRYFLLQAHYRSSIEFSWEALEASRTALKRLAEHVQTLPENGNVSETYKKQFEEKIADDLDTPGVLALIWTLLKDDSVQDADKRSTIEIFDEVLGLSLSSLSFDADTDIPEEVQKLAEKREEARKEKNWQEADTLRDDIAKKGFIVKDTDSGFEMSTK